MKRKAALLVSLVLVLSLLFTACAGTGSSNSGKLDTLAVNVGPDPDTIDPALNSSVDGATMIIHAFEGLMTLDKNSVPVPGQAKSYDVTDNDTTYTFHLRDNLKWNDGQPIYRQLRDFVVEMILDGKLAEGDVLPSVRHVAGEFRVNPLTVLKSYQLLVGEGLVESRRGRGMFVNPGARQQLLASEREKFLAEEWPRVLDTLHRLGLSAKELLPKTGQ